MAHATDGRLQGRAENASWRKDEEHDTTGYDGVLQDGRSGEPGCQVNMREEGKREKGRQRKRETQERGDRKGSPHGLQAAAKRKVTPKRWHAALCCLYRISLNITGSFVEIYKSRSSNNYFL